MHGSDIGSFTLNNNNCTVTIMVWKSVISDVGIKFVDATNAAQPEIKVANTLINQWEELTFDFSSRIGVYPITKDQIVIFPDFDLGGRTQDNIIYFDNVYNTNTNTAIINYGLKDLTIHPNPAKGLVNIDIQNYKGPIEVKIYDLMGSLIAKTNHNLIDIKLLPKGLYFFSVSYNNISELVKIIKD